MKFVGVAITITIGIILVGSLLMPVISDAQEGERDVYNNHGYPVREVGTETVEYTFSEGTITTTDGTITSVLSNGALLPVTTDTGFLHSNVAGTSFSVRQFDPSGVVTTGITSGKVTVDGSAKTVTVSDIVASSTVDDITWTYDNWCFVPDTDGTMVEYLPTSTAATFYVEDDWTLYSFYHKSTTWYAAMTGTGVVSTSSSTVTITTNFTSTEFEGSVSTIEVSTADTNQYNITAGSSSYTPDFIVVNKTTTIYSENGESIIGLYAIIPVMIIVGILVYAVRSVTERD